MFQLWFFMAQKLPAVRNMFFQPVRRVFQVRKDDFFNGSDPIAKIMPKKTKVETL